LGVELNRSNAAEDVDDQTWKAVRLAMDKSVAGGALVWQAKSQAERLGPPHSANEEVRAQGDV
jgi:hypothetical protein